VNFYPSLPFFFTDLSETDYGNLHIIVDVLLTVHLSIILAVDQLSAQILVL